MRHALVLSLAMLSTTALAVPLEFNHQGRLMDSSGAPLSTPTDLTLSLYATDTGGTAAWTETHTGVGFDNGYYTLAVGSVTPLDSSAFDGSTLWLELDVGGSVLADRIAMVSVPYALRAGDAESADSLVDGAVIDVSELRVNGTTVADSSGLLDNDSLAELGCTTTGDLAMLDGSGAWQCLNQNALAIDAGQLVGTLDILQLPVGTGDDNVASGSHGHTAADVGALPSGTTAADIGALPSGTTAADIGALPSSTTAADIGGATWGTYGSGTCSTAGEITWSGSNLYACDGADWRPLAYMCRMDGSSAEDAGPSCADILAADSGAADGTYWIDPDGAGGVDPMQLQCDMGNGGWTQLYLSDFSSDADGWSAGTPQTCGSFGEILGGYNQFGSGASTQQTWDLSAWSHTEARVDFNFVKSDSWDGESGRMYVDGTQQWSQSYVHTQGTQECGYDGGPGSWAELSDAQSWNGAHTANSLTVMFNSTLDQAANDENWGIQNIVVWVR